MSAGPGCVEEKTLLVPIMRHTSYFKCQENPRWVYKEKRSRIFKLMSSLDNNKSSDSAPKTSHDKAADESGASLYYEAAKHFSQSFLKSAAAPLTGGSELLGLSSRQAPTEKATTADQLGTIAGTAFDAI
jgi:hypothetical protein